MRILFIDQFSALGGAQHCLLDLLPAIEERGWSAIAMLPSEGPLVEKVRALGIEVVEIAATRYGNGKKSAMDMLQFAANVPAQAAAIRRVLRQTSVDLVYVNGPRLLAAAAIATRKRIPVLFHAHHCIGQRSARIVEGIALRRSGATIAACCHAVARPLEQWTRDRIHVIPTGTADLGFRAIAPMRNREVRVGIIGRISPEKGQVEFMHAAAVLAKRSPNMRFVVCGAPLFGDAEYYREVLRLAADLPVELIDWQDNVGDVMRELDLLVIASKQEGIPRVLLEAFSAGVPVVATPVGGIPEAVEDGVTGFLAKQSLATRIAEAASMDTAILDSVARKARERWERSYTLPAYRTGITDLIERCVQRQVPETAAPQPPRAMQQRPARENTRNV